MKCQIVSILSSKEASFSPIARIFGIMYNSVTDGSFIMNMSIRLPDSLHKRIKQMAAAEGISFYEPVYYSGFGDS